LREVLAQQEQVLPPRFALLQARRTRRLRWQRALLLSALALALLGGYALRHQEAQPSIRAELAKGASPPPITLIDTARPGPAPALATLASEAAARPATSTVASVKSSPPKLVHSAEAQPLPIAAEAAERPAAETAGSAKVCAQLARDGAAEQALGCYQSLSSGAGMTAELALFEQARLEGKVLRRPERALRTLSDYRRRFPNGSLRGEAMLAQIDWLLAAGEPAQALHVVDEALGSGLLRERTAELERLRATLSAQPAP
jgi:hypothetical protein